MKKVQVTKSKTVTFNFFRHCKIKPEDKDHFQIPATLDVKIIREVKCAVYSYTQDEYLKSPSFN